MALRYSELKSGDEVIRSITGLDRVAFLKLAQTLKIVWDEYIQRFTIEGKERLRASKGRVNNVLPTIEDKLLFILYFLKTNPIQQSLALQFDMNQPQAQRWVTLLSELLIKALDRERTLPVRDSKSLIALLNKKQIQEKEQEQQSTQKKEQAGADAGNQKKKKQLLMLDSTERRVNRKEDYEMQKQYYSGKKKRIA